MLVIFILFVKKPLSNFPKNFPSSSTGLPFSCEIYLPPFKSDEPHRPLAIIRCIERKKIICRQKQKRVGRGITNLCSMAPMAWSCLWPVCDGARGSAYLLWSTHSPRVHSILKLPDGGPDGVRHPGSSHSRTEWYYPSSQNRAYIYTTCSLRVLRQPVQPFKRSPPKTWKPCTAPAPNGTVHVQITRSDNQSKIQSDWLRQNGGHIARNCD